MGRPFLHFLGGQALQVRGRETMHLPRPLSPPTLRRELLCNVRAWIPPSVDSFLNLPS